jgi:hypothetical protein
LRAVLGNANHLKILLKVEKHFESIADHGLVVTQ